MCYRAEAETIVHLSVKYLVYNIPTLLYEHLHLMRLNILVNIMKKAFLMLRVFSLATRASQKFTDLSTPAPLRQSLAPVCLSL